MLETEHNYYKKNRSKIFIQYPGKTVVIKGEHIIGVYESHEQAYSATIQQHEIGTFLIKTMVKRSNLFA